MDAYGTTEHLAAILHGPKDFRRQVLSILRREFGTLRGLLESDIAVAERLYALDRAMAAGSPMFQTLPRIDFDTTTPEEQAGLWLEDRQRQSKEEPMEEPNGGPPLQTKWRKVHDLLDELAGEPKTAKERQDFVDDYNRRYSGKPKPGNSGELWDRLSVRKLGELIRQRRKKPPQ